MNKPKHKNPSFSDFVKELRKSEVTDPKPISRIPERKYFLIVCEGERTEPLYFNYFKTFLPNNFIETVEVIGEGDNTINIVNKAIELRDERIRDVLKPNFDEVWAVYDKDDFPSQRFNRAVQLAGINRIHSGHSNQSFELWYILHFQFLQTALHRDDYKGILTQNLGFRYEKNDLGVVEYLFRECNVKRAITWAKKLEEMNEGLSPARSCPSTTVYKLVEKLDKYCRHNA
jgi:hypothetical protein